MRSTTSYIFGTSVPPFSCVSRFCNAKSLRLRSSAYATILRPTDQQVLLRFRTCAWESEYMRENKASIKVLLCSGTWDGWLVARMVNEGSGRGRVPTLFSKSQSRA